MSVFHLVFFRCHSVSPKWGFHKRYRCPITLPNRLAQLDILLLCNHIVHYIRLSFRFQSSLPRGERQGIPCDQSKHRTISIRAPARGATADLVCNIGRIFISIRAPARGATSRGDAVKWVQWISIRAPARGATISGEGFQCLGYIFQSALPRGERRSPWVSLRWIYPEFQSALPRGERPPGSCRMIWFWVYFNPRSREGSDCRREM